jgi:hypothetical protein
MNFLLNHRVSGGVSIQMAFLLKLSIAQFGAVIFYFTKNAPHLKKNRKW